MTGAGIVSALGIGKDRTLNALLSDNSGIGEIAHLETEHKEFPAGEVCLSNAEMSLMLNAEYPVTELRTALLGCLALKEAISQSKLDLSRLRGAAFVNGTTVGGMDKTERHFKKVYEAGGNCIEGLELKYNDCGYSTELIADSVGKFGMVTTTSTACSSAANAIILGANLIKAGVVDIAVVGGSEALSKFHLNGFNSLMILDRKKSRPFDSDRSGINLGEGAAYLVLENESSAKRRHANIMGVLSGYANTCDAYHQTATSSNGEGAYLAMLNALSMANLKPEDIDYINAHGTGTPNNDESELAAMERIWNHELPLFSSTKSFTGHTTSASGAIEAVICLLSIANNFVPTNLGWQNPIRNNACPTSEKRIQNVDNVICNSFGFGGNDSTLIFSKYSG